MNPMVLSVEVVFLVVHTLSNHTALSEHLSLSINQFALIRIDPVFKVRRVIIYLAKNEPANLT